MNKIIRWLLFGLGLMVMLACSPAILFYDLGITRFCHQNEQIVAFIDNVEDEGGFITSGITKPHAVTSNGGLRWQPYLNQEGACEFESLSYPFSSDSWSIQAGETQFNILPTDGIYRVEENDVAVKEFDLSFLYGEAHITVFNVEASYGNFNDLENQFYRPGPWDAIYDQQTGNLLFAMGLEGVLLRTSQGEWEWINVGRYNFDPHVKPDLTVELILMTVLLPLYVFSHVTSHHYGRFIGFVVLWGVWAFITLTYRSNPLAIETVVETGFRFAGMFDIWFILIGGCLPVYLILGIMPSIIYALIFPRLRDTVFYLMMLCAMYIAPYVLWAEGIMLHHTTASIISLTLTTLILGWLVWFSVKPHLDLDDVPES